MPFVASVKIKVPNPSLWLVGGGGGGAPGFFCPLFTIIIISLVDGHGWAPTRRMKDVVWGLYSLFDDLLNFEVQNRAERGNFFLLVVQFTISTPIIYPKIIIVSGLKQQVTKVDENKGSKLKIPVY